MRYWWVNQNQTYSQETSGGYLWSPKRRSDGSRNPFYEFMREIAPGDVVFSFAYAHIQSMGIAQSTAYETPKPPEFGAAGPNWSDIGWKVAVRYFALTDPIRPADFIGSLREHLPEKYSPLQANGRGNQGIYLTALPEPLTNALLALMGPQARDIVNANFVSDASIDQVLEVASEVADWEEHLTKQIQHDRSLDDTQKNALVKARRGQGTFKRNVSAIERRCRVTGVERLDHLIASHSKPWRDCESYEERLDGQNGLLLAPNIDHLYDRGLISFEGNGRLLIAPVAHRESLRRMGVPVTGQINVGSFTDGQKRYLEFHRDSVFLQARE